MHHHPDHHSAPDHLFVYGTLRRQGRNEMQRQLAAQATFQADAWFQGRLFQVAHYPGACASPDRTDRVVGELYALGESRALLALLDEYEECSPRFPDPREYRREKKCVHTTDGRAVEAWIYLYNRPVDGLVRIESGDFFRQG